MRCFSLNQTQRHLKKTTKIKEDLQLFETYVKFDGICVEVAVEKLKGLLFLRNNNGNDNATIWLVEREARAKTTPQINDMIGWMKKNNRAARPLTTQHINDVIGWMRKNNRAARAARFLVQFFDLVCQTMTRNLQIWGSDNNASTQQ